MNIEPLESRIAPASILNPTTATFTDVDGDFVTIKFSKPIAQQVTFLTVAGPASIPGGEQLQRLDLGGVTAAAAEGVNITFTAVPKDVNGDGIKDGDGHVNIGAIFGNKHLGAVTIPGDLGQITAGDNSNTVPAIKSLTVDSMGEYGLTTGAPGIQSILAGPVGSISVKGNFRDVFLAIQDGAAVRLPLGSLSIGGSFIGGDATSKGLLTCSTIGSVKIGGNLEGGLASFTGMIRASGKIASLTIGGSVLGLRGDISGAIEAGALGNVQIGGDVRGDDLGGYIASAGAIGNVTIGGSLVGTYDGGGLIKAGGDIGAVKIGGDVQGGIGSAAGLGSGRIEAGGKIASVSVRGSLIGFAGDASGSIFSIGRLGPVSIGGNVLGHDGAFSGSVRSDTRIDSVRIGGSVQGGSGLVSGALYCNANGIGAVTIAHDLIGSYGASSGAIFAGLAPLPSVVIGGSVIGGIDPDLSDGILAASNSGAILSGAIGTLSIAGDLVGHAQNSGNVIATTIAKMQIGGSIYGGEREDSGVVQASDRIGSLSIGGDLVSGYYLRNARILATTIDALAIHGSLRGDFHGTVDGAAAIEATGAIGTLSIGGDVVGSGEKSGYISGALGIKTLTIGGSLLGGYGSNSGVVTTGGTLGTAKIVGDIRGSNTAGVTLENTGAILARRIGNLTVCGSIFSGTKDGGILIRSGSITADETIGALTVKGSLVGNSSQVVLITAGGNPAATGNQPDLAIGSITIGGRVDHTFFLAGYNKNGIGVSADASVGAVKVGGDWIASYLSAGVEPGPDFLFGTPDDRLLPGGANFGGGPVRDNAAISKIASIVIGGQIKSGFVSGLGGAQGNQTYGFVAQQIGSFKYDDIVVPLKAGASNDTFALGKARPLGASRSSLNADGFAMHVFEV